MMIIGIVYVDLSSEQKLKILDTTGMNGNTWTGGKTWAYQYTYIHHSSPSDGGAGVLWHVVKCFKNSLFLPSWLEIHKEFHFNKAVKQDCMVNAASHLTVRFPYCFPNCIFWSLASILAYSHSELSAIQGSFLLLLLFFKIFLLKTFLKFK